MKVYEFNIKFSPVFLEEAKAVILAFIIMGGKGGTIPGLYYLGVIESGRLSMLYLD